MFVVDLDDELDSDSLPNAVLKKTCTRLATIKECLQNYAYLKSWMRPASVGASHEFGLLGLTSTICWQVPFTPSAATFAETVGSLVTCGRFASCDLDGTLTFAEAELQARGQTAGPSLRVVLLYGRANCAPRWSVGAAERYSWLLQHPLFFFDAVYLHPKLSTENNVQAVFDAITDLEKLMAANSPSPDGVAAAVPLPDQSSVGAPVVGSARDGGTMPPPPPAPSARCCMIEGTALAKVHRMFATLLAHPLHRPPEPAEPVIFGSSGVGLPALPEPEPALSVPVPRQRPATPPRTINESDRSGVDLLSWELGRANSGGSRSRADPHRE